MECQTNLLESNMFSCLRRMVDDIMCLADGMIIYSCRRNAAEIIRVCHHDVCVMDFEWVSSASVDV